jgi:hypothetical protein
VVYILNLIVYAVLVIGILSLLFGKSCRDYQYDKQSEIPKIWHGVWKTNDRWDYHDTSERIIINKKSLWWITPVGYIDELEVDRVETKGNYPNLELRVSFLDDHNRYSDSTGWKYFSLEELQMFKVYCPSCSKVHSFSLEKREVDE